MPLRRAARRPSTRRVPPSRRRIYEEVIGAFKQKDPERHHQLRRRWLGQGPPGLRRPGRRLRRHGRAVQARGRGRLKGGTFFYFPTVAAPITVSYNLKGVKSCSCPPDTLAKIFQGEITTWDDAAIKADNKGAKLPSTDDHRGAPLRQLGDDGELHEVPHRRGTDRVDARLRLDRELAGRHAGGPRQRGRRSDGQEHRRRHRLRGLRRRQGAEAQFARIKNKDGKFVAPSVKATTAAVDKAQVKADLTYDPLNARGAERLPDRGADLVDRVPEPERRGEGHGDQELPELHLRGRPEAGPRGGLRTAAQEPARQGQGPGQAGRSESST